MTAALGSGTAAALRPTAPEHLIEVPETCGEWTLWRCAALRGAGFPAALVLQLADPDVAQTADALLQSIAQVAIEKQNARKLLDNCLDELRNRDEWDDESKRETLLRARREVQKGKAPAVADACLQTFRDSLAARNQWEAEFGRQINAAAVRTTERIRSVASDPLFQEAVIWQNRRVFHSVLEKCIYRSERDDTPKWKWRQREELIASYLQRYCVKNDTIGYFGPVGWAAFIDRPGYIEAAPGTTLLARRQVYLESWAIDALSAALAANQSLRRWMHPRLTPFTRIENGKLHTSGAPPFELAPHQLALLESCDGATAAADLASAFLRNPNAGFRSEREILLLLERFRARNLITWDFPVRVAPAADEALGALISQIRDEQARQECLAPLSELRAAADAVRRSAGCVEKLDAAIADLESVFTRLTQTAAVRSRGQTYAGRTLLYEDCRRNVDVSLGADLLQELARPLALILTSARWYTHTIATRCERIFQCIYDELAAETGCAAVEATRFWYRFQPFLLDGEENILAAAMADFQRNWMDILQPTQQLRRLAYTWAELHNKVDRLFAAPCPGWQMARYHSPDVIIGATGPDAINRGQFQFVLGEIHVGVNTLNQCLFLNQHPNPDQVEKWIESDLPDPMVARVPPKDWLKLTTRTQIAYISPRACRLVDSPAANGAAVQRAVPLTAFKVEAVNGRLVVKSHARDLAFGITEFFADALSYLLNDGFRLLPAAPHLPRITIDRLVAVRESWHIHAAEMPFAAEPNAASRFLGVRIWARQMQMPRFLFVRAPVEKKPFYVDLDSPMYVDILCKNVHRTQKSDLAQTPLEVTEMLPLPQESWLMDHAGQRFTSEFRLVAVDWRGRADGQELRRTSEGG